METQKPLLKDEDGEEVDVHLYRLMIGSLMYLTSSRLDITVCACARYQVNPKVSHLHVVKRIFRYLKYQPKLGLWYPKDLPFDLVAYTNSGYAGANLDRKSTTGAVWNEIGVNADNSKLMLPGITYYYWVTTAGRIQLQALMDRKKIIITEATVRRDLQLEDVDGVDCLLNATIFEQLTLMGMVKNLDSAVKFLMYPRFVQVFLNNKLEGMATHNRVYIAPSHIKKGEGLDMPTDPHHTPIIIPPSTSQPQRKHRLRKLKRKDTEIPQSSLPVKNVAHKAVYEERDDSLETTTTTGAGLDAEQDRGVNTPQSGEDSLQLKELMEFCTKLQQRVLDLENTKTAQAQEITSLKKRVKKLERKKKSRTHGLKRLYKVGLSARFDSSDDEASLGDQEDASKQERKIHDIDADEDITLENVHDADMFGVHDINDNEVFVETKEPVVNAATTTSTILVSAAKDLSDVDKTLAQALAELKSTKPKAVTTTATITTTTVTRPKDKGLVIQEQEQESTPITSSKDKGKGIIV
ncbi:hypothetical protein Tco_0943149 [Tanacetum coccineum]